MILSVGVLALQGLYLAVPVVWFSPVAAVLKCIRLYHSVSIRGRVSHSLPQLNPQIATLITMTTTPPETQWLPGRLLQRAREQHGLSKPEAAHAAGLSVSWWRRLESGFTYRGGERVPVKASDAALIKAAAGVGISPEEILNAAGLRTTPSGREGAHQLVDTLPEHLVDVAAAYMSGLLDAQALPHPVHHGD